MALYVSSKPLTRTRNHQPTRVNNLNAIGMRKSKSFATVCHFFIGGLKNLQRTTRSHDDKGGLKNRALSNLLGLITFLWLLL